jgi:formylmethanofuran dehydrogenase subunit C
MLTLALHTPPAVPLEAPGLTPDRLAGMSATEVSRLPVRHGREPATVGDFFHANGDASDLRLMVEGDCSRVKYLGAGMTAGEVTIVGAAGMHAGAEMTGGRLIILGPADDWLGAEMRGGEIVVRGPAGHHAGAAYPGSRRGMRGGVLLVDGPAGDGCGAVLRRGLIATRGAGDYAAASMIAGSLFAFGPIGRYPAMAMKRGTLAAFGPRPALLPTFRRSGVFPLPFLTLFFDALARRDFAVPPVPAGVERYCGDLLSTGRGEVLLPAGGL